MAIDSAPLVRWTQV